MYQSDCYNFDWLKNWLSRKLIKSSKDCSDAAPRSAQKIAQGFSRCYFTVSTQDIIEALTTLGYEYIVDDNSYLFYVSNDSPAFEEFQKTYD